MLSLQKTMINLLQNIQLQNHLNQYEEFEKLGAIDVYYLEAINQFDNPTIGMVSKKLKQSTPNTNYHIKKLMNLGLIKKEIDDKDRRVFHLQVTEKYKQMTDSNSEFWQDLQDSLEEKVSASDMATFKRVLDETLSLIKKSWDKE